MKRITVVGGMLMSVAALAVSVPTNAVAAEGNPPRYQHYVALGDSYSAVGDLTELEGPLGCTRSTENYPTHLQAMVGAATFTDATCGEARTPNMTGPQSIPGGFTAPQLDSLTPDTDLVTLTIGFNDLDFGTFMGTCIAMSTLGPGSNLCETTLGAQEKQTRAARVGVVADKVGATIDNIRQRSPHADIVYVSYLNMLPDGGPCATMPMVSPADVKYLHDVQHAAALILRTAAGRHGAIEADTTTIGGHDLCQPAENRWVEPLVPATTTTPFHPNPAGATAMAGVVATALGY
ncbi:SGNH/GDSL hydrolase family protein [Nocardia sp. A7]|uniref:SGNH/GDSL hydrolase family protein n=1 Tax=Nocardia sp. A7 TaxID=2789274 RepID=UPI00397A4DD5